MVPMITRIRAHDIKEFGELIRHQGEEFIFVLEGTIEVHLQFYTPVTLSVGRAFTSTAPWVTPTPRRIVRVPW